MFDRTLKIIDEFLLEKIKNTKVLLVGVGGVGGFTLEYLVRLGISNITIIDYDEIEESNLNRQIITCKENIGKKKIEEAKKRALSINPNLNIKALDLFLNKDNIDNILNEKYDFYIDACDTISTKILLIKYALENKKQIISCMGMGNRINPSKVSITSLNKTYNDPLAKVMRNELKKRNISLNIPVVWSSEVPIKTKDKTLGSIVLPPASAAMQIAYYILTVLKDSI